MSTHRNDDQSQTPPKINFSPSHDSVQGQIRPSAKSILNLDTRSPLGSHGLNVAGEDAERGEISPRESTLSSRANIISPQDSSLQRNPLGAKPASGRQWAASWDEDGNDEEEAQLRFGRRSATGNGSAEPARPPQAAEPARPPHLGNGADKVIQGSFRSDRGNAGGDKREAGLKAIQEGSDGRNGGSTSKTHTPHDDGGLLSPASQRTPGQPPPSQRPQPLLLLPPGRAADEEFWAALLPGEDRKGPAGALRTPGRRPVGGLGRPASPGLCGGSGSSSKSSPGLSAADGRYSGGEALEEEDLVRLAAGVALRRRSSSPDGLRVPSPDNRRSGMARRASLLLQVDAEDWDVWDVETRRLRHPLVRSPIFAPGSGIPLWFSFLAFPRTIMTILHCSTYFPIPAPSFQHLIAAAATAEQKPLIGQNTIVKGTAADALASEWGQEPGRSPAAAAEPAQPARGLSAVTAAVAGGEEEAATVGPYVRMVSKDGLRDVEGTDEAYMPGLGKGG